jgi:hemerythrin
MPYMQWTEAMSVGSPDLDEDHKHLFFLTNRLSSLSDGHATPEDAQQALQTLTRYAQWHFAREECVMAACGFPGDATHKVAHERFGRTAAGFLKKFEANPDKVAPELCREIYEFLQDWLTHHILVQDMAYKPHVMAKTAEASQAIRSVRGADLAWGV